LIKLPRLWYIYACAIIAYDFE